jgi:choline dehydrogenase
MGTKDDALSVLNNQFEVKGIEGLRVVDGSAMPKILSGNINTPILMMAEKVGALIK